MIRVQSAITLHFILDKSDDAKRFLRPALKDLVNVLLEIMREVDDNEIVITLEKVVTYYKDDIEPFAIQLVTMLRDTFNHLSQIEISKEDGNTVMEECVSCLSTLFRILTSCKRNRELLNKLEGLINQTLHNILSEPQVLFYEEATDLLIILLYYGSLRDSQGRTVS